MDNDKLSKIPVSELTPENLNSLKKRGNVSLPESSTKDKKGNRLPLIIAAIILLIGVGVAMYFIFRKPVEEPTPAEQPVDQLEPVWEPTEESADPSAEYIDHHETIINNPDSTPAEKLASELSIVGHYIALERYDDAEAKLNSLQREGRSYRELFQIYSSYVNLYDASGNEASKAKYEALLDEVLDANWGEASD